MSSSRAGAWRGALAHPLPAVAQAPDRTADGTQMRLRPRPRGELVANLVQHVTRRVGEHPQQRLVVAAVEDAVGRGRLPCALPRLDIAISPEARDDALDRLPAGSFAARPGAQTLPDVPVRLPAKLTTPDDHPADVFRPCERHVKDKRARGRAWWRAGMLVAMVATTLMGACICGGAERGGVGGSEVLGPTVFLAVHKTQGGDAADQA